MLEKPLAKLEELEKRLDRLLKSAPRFRESKALASELEVQVKELSENLAREKAARSESEKSSTARITELDDRARKLDDRLGREKKLREEAADRVAGIISDLGEEKPGHG